MIKWKRRLDFDCPWGENASLTQPPISAHMQRVNRALLRKKRYSMFERDKSRSGGVEASLWLLLFKGRPSAKVRLL